MDKLSVLGRIALGTSLAGCLLAGCTKEARKGRLLDAAERDFQAGAYDKAKIEYLNVLRLDGQNATAFSRLGKIWFDEGVPMRAGGLLIRARELTPNDLENRLRLARVYNAVGKREDGKKEALFVLEHSPSNGEALLLLTEMALTPQDVSSAEQLMSGFPEKESVLYYLAGANLAMHKQDFAAAQRLLDRALAIVPKSAETHRSRAILFLMQKNVKGAGSEFKAAAELAPARSSMRLSYADYLMRTGDMAEGTAYLKAITKDTPDFLPAWMLLARTALSEKKYDEGLTLLENIFSRDPDSVDGRLIQADIFLLKRQTKKAVDVLETLNRNHPGAPGIKFQLARAYLRDDKIDQASASLTQAITANPNYTEAILLLAEINLRTRHAGQAITALEGLVKNGADLNRAQILLAEAYRAVGRLDDAAAIIRQQIAQSPKDAEAHILLGLIQEQQTKLEDARHSFEKALELAPDKLLPLAKLVDLDLAAKNFDTAMRRVQQRIQKDPNSGNSHLLLSKVLAAKKQWIEAEAALKKAIQLDPSLASAYDLLVGVYLETGKGDEAIRELETVLTKSPRNKGALITLASVEGKRGDYTKARDAYEQVLAFDPNNVTALNNLAYIYVERLNQLDTGLELARKARIAAPADAAVADTLGWILFKRDDYPQALSLLDEAARKITDDPEIRYHLGMAHYMMGLVDAAKSDFEQALGMARDFSDKKEAEHRLELLSQIAKGSDALTTEQLENLLKQYPKDVVVRLRLAEAYKTQNSPDRAATTYEEALKFNPKLASVALRLAELYVGPLKNPQKALEFAKKARDLDPSDPRAAGILGRIAFDAGNFSWAYSLLQESSRQADFDAKVLHDLAWAAYSLGKVEEARHAMQQALNASPDAETAADGKLFLAMTGVELEPSARLQGESDIEPTLKRRPDYVPALMAAGALDFQDGRVKEAVAHYQAALRKFPDFPLAQKQLAFVYSKEPTRIAEAYDLALKARKSLPTDRSVAQLLGQLSYERKEYSRAVQLLQESSRKEPLDARGLYYLGLSYKETKHPAEAKKALVDALAGHLPAPLAEEARRVLSEL